MLAPDSELNELFAETEQYEEWCAVLDDLRLRIGAGTKATAQVRKSSPARDQLADRGKGDKGNHFPWPGLAGILATYREGGRDFWRRALDLERIRPG